MDRDERRRRVELEAVAGALRAVNDQLEAYLAQRDARRRALREVRWN